MPKKGFKFSIESIEKMRIAHSGERNGMYGKKHSDETKRKIGKANLNP